MRPPVARHRWTFGLAAGSLALATATGIGAQTGAVDTSSVRWVHHALYAASLATSLVALAAATPTRRRALAPSALALVAMPRTRGGSARHAAAATFAVASCAAAALV